MEVEPTILLPGSFNPIHKGHLSIAENVLRAMPEATLWFVVSPQNPLKSPSELAAERHRLQMARIAVGSSPLRERMAVCDVEFTLPKPSLTLRTLDILQAKYPSRRFALLVGTDIVGEFGRWYRSGEILDRFEVLVYPRGTEPGSVSDERFTFLKDVPTIPVVATDIRARIRRGENPADDLPPGVWEYIKENGLYGYAR